jgi:hypothetical protein
MREVRVWRYDPAQDALPDIAEPGDLDDRRTVLLAAPTKTSPPSAWLAVDDYDVP